MVGKQWKKVDECQKEVLMNKVLDVQMTNQIFTNEKDVHPNTIG